MKVLVYVGKTGHVSVSDAETFDSPQVGVFLSGADLKVKVKSADEALALLQRASSVRSTRSVPLLCSVGGKQQQQYLSSRYPYRYVIIYLRDCKLL